MVPRSDAFSSRRLDNMKRNKALLQELGATAQAKTIQESMAVANARSPNKPPSAKRRRVEGPQTLEHTTPKRSSARLAESPSKPLYNEKELAEKLFDESPVRTKKQRQTPQQRRGPAIAAAADDNDDQESTTSTSALTHSSLDELRASWSSWTPTAPAPTRDEKGVFHFASHPEFTPNKSPAEVLREGAFGGSYFRPLFSKKLGIVIADDHRELPPAWIEGLDASRYLVAAVYDADANKFKVACGQSIEAWEAAGWIDHRFDVRGWFQWYCRFFAGRRCEDDERQVRRWKGCVGVTGRWRRTLLKKYAQAGVRTVWDDGEEEDVAEVSPVIHQTCHHWAFEVTQDVLDEYWESMK